MYYTSPFSSTVQNKVYTQEKNNKNETKHYITTIKN